MARLGSVVVALLLGASLAQAGAEASTPLELYHALLTTRYANSELPNGFSSATISAQPVTGPDEHAGIVGLLTVDLKGPDRIDVIAYTVYATPAAARHDLGLTTNYCCGARLHTIPGGLPGSSLPSHIVSGTAPLKTGATKSEFAITVIEAAKGNVVVGATTANPTKPTTKRTTTGPAITLARSGLAHLGTVSAHH